MSCPSVSPPPGPFDLGAPHNLVLVGGLALLFALVLASTLGWVRTSVRHLRARPRGRERSFLLWLTSVAAGWELAGLLLFSLVGLWGVAFVTWPRPAWQPACPVDPVVAALAASNQMGSVLIAFLLGSSYLISAGGVLVLLVQRRIRTGTERIELREELSRGHTG